MEQNIYAEDAYFANRGFAKKRHKGGNMRGFSKLMEERYEERTSAAELGVEIARYAALDEEINAIYFLPLGSRVCCAIIDFDGNAARISNNIRAVMLNNVRGVKLSLYSARSEAGMELMKDARQLYQKEEKVKRTRKRKKKEEAPSEELVLREA